MYEIQADDGRDGGRLRQFALLVALGAVLILGLQAAVQAASAEADYCEPSGGTTLCLWASINLPAGQERWFQAPGGNNLRNWIAASVGDAYGGSVTQKCVHIMRSDGARFQIACGSGTPGNAVAGYMDPGYLFIRHGAPGPRSISGAGTSP
jgi:hypothetical protein